MRVLALDLSSPCTGYAVLEGEQGRVPKLVDKGNVKLTKPAKDCGNGSYPWNYLAAVNAVTEHVMGVVREFDEIPVIVIEETNLGKQRYSQKILEWLHLRLLQRLCDCPHGNSDGIKPHTKVYYVASRSWRKTLGLALSKDQRATNQKVSRAKQKAKGDDGRVDVKKFNAEKKKLGVKGRINWKTLSVDFVNRPFEEGGMYGLQLKKGDNDIADAICVGTAFFLGAEICDGTSEQ